MSHPGRRWNADRQMDRCGVGEPKDDAAAAAARHVHAVLQVERVRDDVSRRLARVRVRVRVTTRVRVRVTIRVRVRVRLDSAK